MATPRRAVSQTPDVVSFEALGVTFGMSICFDLQFLTPEAALLKQGVYDKDNFLWASQLRPKWVTEEEKILFSICDARVPYGYE